MQSVTKRPKLQRYPWRESRILQIGSLQQSCLLLLPVTGGVDVGYLVLIISCEDMDLDLDHYNYG